MTSIRWLHLIGRRSDGAGLEPGARGARRHRDTDRPAATRQIDDTDDRTCDPDDGTVYRSRCGDRRRGRADGGVRTDPADRVRKRRESAARARHGEEPGDRDTSLARRDPRARDSSAADRKPADLDRRRPARLGARAVVVSGARRRSRCPSALPPEVPSFASDLDFSPDIRVLSFAMVLTLGTASCSD